MIVLGIETSCDETAVALVEDGRRILVDLVSSQTGIHEGFGGVVPELASRAQLRVLLPLLERAREQSVVALNTVDAIAFTRGPGLIGSLLVGTAVAKALAYTWKLPLLGVNHLKAHLYAPCLEGASFDFPLVGLLVSGGHTVLVHALSWEEARILGQTRDDAAGEAFDKVACLLKLGYPGGPAIERAGNGGDPKKFRFPRGMINSRDLDFSFSGLKTAVRYAIQKLERTGRSYSVADIAAGFQSAVVEVLVRKLKLAVLTAGARTVVVGGGVARNALLRASLRNLFPPEKFSLLIPSPHLCSDNAAMVAGLACRRWQEGKRDDWSVDAAANLPWDQGLL